VSPDGLVLSAISGKRVAMPIIITIARISVPNDCSSIIAADAKNAAKPKTVAPPIVLSANGLIKGVRNRFAIAICK